MEVNHIDKNETIQLLIELLKIPSITPKDLGCQELLISRLERMGFICERMNFHETSNLWAKIGHSRPLVCFAGHTDVVPVGNFAEWLSHPFQPEIREGYLYARGAADMKSGLAASVIAIESFLKNNPDFSGSVALLITSDEEGDNVDGTPRVVKELEKRGEWIDYCIVAEPTSLKQLGDTIKNGRRGSMSGKVKIKGKQGHIAYPQLAVNPIHQTVPALEELINYQWDQGNQYFPPTSFQISNIHAGVGAGNVIPGELEIWFNFRFSTENTVEALQQIVTDIFNKYQLSYEIAWQVSGYPFITPEGILTKVAKQIIQEELQLVPQVNTLGGISDGRFIKSIADELIELGPVNDTIHQINECVNVDDVIKLTFIYERMINLLLKQNKNFV